MPSDIPLPPTDAVSPPQPVWGKAFSGDDAARTYRVRSEETWAAAREDYECGWTAEEICRRYDIGLSAFRQRARREEWRKCDIADQEPEPFPPEPQPALSTAELIDLAWRSMSDAMRRGRVYEARAWVKLAADLKDRLRDEEWQARQAQAAERPQSEKEALAAGDKAINAILTAAKLGKTQVDRLHRTLGDDQAGEGGTPENGGDAARTAKDDEVAASTEPGPSHTDELHTLHPVGRVQSSPSGAKAGRSRKRRRR